MERKQRSDLALGVVLVLVGVFAILERFVPAFSSLRQTYFEWPAIVIGFGSLLLLIGLITANWEMFAPAMVFAGIGGILYWQNATGRWESWSYLWALIPGFVGLGIFLQGLLGGERLKMREGLKTILVSVVLFAIFGSFLGPLREMGYIWPAVLICIGLYVFVRSLFGSSRES